MVFFWVLTFLIKLRENFIFEDSRKEIEFISPGERKLKENINICEFDYQNIYVIIRYNILLTLNV